MPVAGSGQSQITGLLKTRMCPTAEDNTYTALGRVNLQQVDVGVWRADS